MGNRFTPINLRSMLQSRMGWNMEDPLSPFVAVECHRLSSGRVTVFLCSKDSSFLIDDEEALYPSDALVTKIRLME